MRTSEGTLKNIGKKKSSKGLGQEYRIIGAPQYIRQIPTAIKGEIDSNTIILGDFNTPLSPMDRSSKMKINKKTQALNDTLKKCT